MYRNLDAEKIIRTVETLHKRIEERFPGSGLKSVCGELHGVAIKSQQRSSWIAKPLKSLRVVVALSIIIILVGLAGIVRNASLPRTLDLIGLVQVSEAGLNVAILLCAAILFLITTERRIKRGRALQAIHELRALAHVIDMHQLTKDPERVLVGTKDTPSSPKRELTSAELTRYLDYCSEMLSLLGKLAALYVQRFDDPVALAAVNDVEQLTNGLSRKIWQKISIVNAARSQPHV